MSVKMADVLERDAGFCSGGDEDDMEAEDGIHSPTDASEDSVDVKVQAISLRNRNKRKCAEPRKLDTDLPAKKRKIDLTVTKDIERSSRSPFRPWSASPPPTHQLHHRIVLPFKSDVRNDYVISVPRLPSPQQSPYTHHPHNVYPVHLPTYSSSHQEEPLSLVSKRKDNEDNAKVPIPVNPVIRLPKGVPDNRLASWPPTPRDLSQVKTNRVTDRGSFITNKVKLQTPIVKPTSDKKVKIKQEEGSDSKFRIDSLLSSVKTEGASTSKSSQGGQQRNYKNMTRERRIEANARERTRVHTISAAFDTLRHSIPAYSHNQKLSKLSVLRIACSYIMTLSRLAGYDYSKDQTEPDLSSCVENVSKTIQTEGKIRKKKED